MSVNKLDAILAIKSDAEVSTLADGSLNWIDGNPTNITEEQIATKLAELQVEYDAKEYQRKRQSEYPNIYDYVDGIVKDDQAQINKYIADCQAVKAKYPK